MAKKLPKDTFVFKTTDAIGSAAAEDDHEFLLSCFVETDEFRLLCGANDTRVIVLGRTGSGKSALFEHFQQMKGDNVILLQPEALSLAHVSHSTVLNNFIALGVNLDPFFSLLWRHVFVVEILHRYFEHHPQPIQDRSVLAQLKSMFTRTDPKIEKAIGYLSKWGDGLLKETEARVKDLTTKMEIQLTDSVKAKLGNKLAEFGLESSDIMKLSSEEKHEIVTNGQTVVSKAQAEDLSQVIPVIDAILSDRQQQYFIVIDRLDENWVEERVRYKLIMALINTAKDFIKIRNAKIVIALRRDLMDRVFRLARDSGFQEEKFTSLYLHMRWTKSQILDVLDKRVSHLVRSRYTKSHVGYKDFLPSKIGDLLIDDFISERCKRPRDVIALFNECIIQAANKSKMSVQEVWAAEFEYSNGRLSALADEWHAEEPLLSEFAQILRARSRTFKLSGVSKEDVENICLQVVSASPGSSGLLHGQAFAVCEGDLEADEFVPALFRMFYKVGLVGLKTSAAETYSWELNLVRAPHKTDFDRNETGVVIATVYRRALGIIDR